MVETAYPTTVLRNTRFLRIWLAQLISQTAQNAINFSILVLVEEASRSSTHMGFAVLSFTLPAVFLSIIAGIVVDRHDKRTVLVVTNILRAIVVLGYLFLRADLTVLYLVTVVFSSISQFFIPAEAATIPTLVTRRQLITAVSLFNVTYTASTLTGMVILAPLLIKLAGFRNLFITISLMYVVAATLVYFLPKQPRQRKAVMAGVKGPSVLSQTSVDLREGWRAISGDRLTWMSMSYLTLNTCLMLVFSTLGPRYVVGAVGRTASDVVYFLAPAGVGIFLGTALVRYLHDRIGKGRMINFGLVSMAFFLLMLGTAQRIGGLVVRGASALFHVARGGSSFGFFPVLIVIALFMGVSLAFLSVPAQTLLQERAPQEARGRIFAAQMAFSNLACAFPMMFIGALGDVIGVRGAFALVGASVAALAAFSIRFQGDMRKPIGEPAFGDVPEIAQAAVAGGAGTVHRSVEEENDGRG